MLAPSYVAYAPLEGSKATPFQIAVRGHVAVMLRRYLRETGMTVADFNEHVIGTARNATTVYPWVNATGNVSPALRKIMARVMGIPEEFFLPHDPEAGEPPQAPERLLVPASYTQAKEAAQDAPERPRKALVPVRPSKPGKPTAATSVLLEPRKAPTAAQSPRAMPVLGFQLFADGSSTVQLNAHLPGDKGKSVLRMLLEADLTPAPETDPGETSDG